MLNVIDWQGRGNCYIKVNQILHGASVSDFNPREAALYLRSLLLFTFDHKYTKYKKYC